VSHGRTLLSFRIKYAFLYFFLHFRGFLPSRVTQSRSSLGDRQFSPNFFFPAPWWRSFPLSWQPAGTMRIPVLPSPPSCARCSFFLSFFFTQPESHHLTPLTTSNAVPIQVFSQMTPSRLSRLRVFLLPPLFSTTAPRRHAASSHPCESGVLLP